VQVLYAGSLANLMERQVGPGFEHTTGDRYEGYGADSQAVANAIKSGVKIGDVFISASPAVDQTLTGKANGDWVRWSAEFAKADLMLGYLPGSKYAGRLRSEPWYDVLRFPGIKVGMTDPRLDPKGKLTVAALHAASGAYRLPARFASTVIKRASVFPEPTLLGRLEAGQLDVGFFYADEAKPARISTVALGRVHESATLTVTVLRRAVSPAAGVAFVHYLLTSARPILAAAGLRLIRPVVDGDPTAVPAALRSLLQ
jgi:molybdate/tungstate transport system substrate-binding protein